MVVEGTRIRLDAASLVLFLDRSVSVGSCGVQISLSTCAVELGVGSLLWSGLSSRPRRVLGLDTSMESSEAETSALACCSLFGVRVVSPSREDNPAMLRRIGKAMFFTLLSSLDVNEDRFFVAS